VLVNGYIIGFDEAVNAITGEVIATGPFSYFWLTNGAECAVCGTTTMITFIVVPLVAGFFTLLFSKLDVMIRGSRARLPVFPGTQPEEYKNYHLNKPDEESEKIDANQGVEEEGGNTSSDNMKFDENVVAENAVLPAQVGA
jgi:SSS family solute:Na+ symporter